MYFKKQIEWFQLDLFLKYAGSNMVYQLITIVAELWILRMVSVELIGTWQYALLIQSYVIASRLGIINAFNRDYPFLISSQDHKKAAAVLSTTGFHVQMSMIVQSLIFLSMAIYQWLQGGQNHMILALMAMVGFTWLEAAANFEEAKLRATLNFNHISRAKIIIAAVSLGSLILPYYYDFAGLLCRAVLLQLSILIFYKLSSKSTVLVKWSRSIWLGLFKDGWRLWLWSYLKNFNKSLPKLFLVMFSTFTVLGLFTPINWMILSFTMFTTALGSYIYPNLSQRFAKGDKNLPLQALVINTISFFISLPFLAVGYFTIPWLIATFLPQYTEAIFPMQIGMIASSLDIFSVTSTVWVAMKDWARMYIFVSVSIVFRILSLAWLYYHQESLLLNLGYSLLFTSVGICLLVLTMITLQTLRNDGFKKKTTILSL